MSETNKKIAEFERKERARNAKYIVCVFVGILLLFLFGFGFSSKASVEIEAEVIGFHNVESDLGSIVKIRFKTIDGVVGIATLPRRVIVNVGDNVVCLRVKTYIGTTKYRFSHILNDKT